MGEIFWGSRLIEYFKNVATGAVTALILLAIYIEMLQTYRDFGFFNRPMLFYALVGIFFTVGIFGLMWWWLSWGIAVVFLALAIRESL